MRACAKGEGTEAEDAMPRGAMVARPHEVLEPLARLERDRTELGQVAAAVEKDLGEAHREEVRVKLRDGVCVASEMEEGRRCRRRR